MRDEWVGASEPPSRREKGVKFEERRGDSRDACAADPHVSPRSRGRGMTGGMRLRFACCGVTRFLDGRGEGDILRAREGARRAERKAGFFER